jgi:hypothetical protein
MPKELQVSFRGPQGRTVASISANGHELSIVGKNKDAALVITGAQRKFEIVAQLR